MKMISLPLAAVAALLLLPACNRRAKMDELSPLPHTPAEALQPLTSSPPEDTLLLSRKEPHLMARLKRTGCYGKCPVFEIEFYSDGQVIYKGEEYAPRQGIYLAHIPDSTVRRIYRWVYDIRYFELKSRYPEKGSPIPDLPQTTTYFYDGLRRKRVVNNHLAPPELIAYERFLAELAESISWQSKVK